MDDWSVRATSRRTWLLIVLLGVSAGLSAMWLLGGGSADAGRTSAHERTTRAKDPLAVLRAWDVRRAAAWAAGDRVRLRGLYTPGSPAGRADLALLDRYLQRGVVVVGMRRQVIRAEVLRTGEQQCLVRVTDRLVGAWAVTRDGPVRRTRLPDSQARTRVLDLRRTDDGWRMRSVTDAPPG